MDGFSVSGGVDRRKYKGESPLHVMGESIRFKRRSRRGEFPIRICCKACHIWRYLKNVDLGMEQVK